MIGLLFLIACGSSPVGPSIITVAAPVVAQTVAKPFPAGLDPAYVRALAVVDSAGLPKRWDGGPMHHCFGPGVDIAVLEPVVARMVAISGIPRTEVGPCNVEWVIGVVPDNTNANTTLFGSATAIVHARVSFATDRASAHLGIARHEGGHVLGLTHSMRPGDLMRADYFDHASGDFTSSELAVLAWIYGR